MIKSVTHSQPSKPGLNRAFGLWNIGAIGINMVIGGGFFMLPSIFYGHTGAWTPWLIIVVGLGLIPVGLCFAEIGSRFRDTGGPYLYIRTAFGRFAGFEIGWMMWVTRVSAHASVMTAMVMAAGYFVPEVAAGWGRAGLVIGVTSFIALLNIIGSRETAFFLTIVTILKFSPILFFIGAGFFHVDWAAFPPLPDVTGSQLSTTALLLVFSLSGFEMLTIPAGEVQRPHVNVPKALIIVILSSVTMMVLANVVTIGLLPNLAQSKTPVAEASFVMFGAPGAVLIFLATIIAAIGHNTSSLIAASRIVLGLAEGRDIPQIFGKIHAKYHTPANAILVTALVIVILTLAGSYELLAMTSALTRLMIYIGVSAATLRLRQARFQDSLPAPSFIPPLARVMPWIAIILSSIVLAGITSANIYAGFAALTIGTVFYSGGRMLDRISSRRCLGVEDASGD
jgi:amino acid transporter